MAVLPALRMKDAWQMVNTWYVKGNRLYALVLAG